MPSPETPESLFTGDQSLAEFTFTVGGEVHTVPVQGSVIRRFQQGGGGLDYLMHTTPDGTLIFMPDSEEGIEIFDKLAKDGFKVEYLPEPDDAAMQMLVELGIIDISLGD